MPKKLVIVASPTKAKAIEGYLGVDYNVLTQYRRLSHIARLLVQ
jgi:DNA topoisomerase IA